MAFEKRSLEAKHMGEEPDPNDWHNLDEEALLGLIHDAFRWYYKYNLTYSLQPPSSKVFLSETARSLLLVIYKFGNTAWIKALYDPISCKLWYDYRSFHKFV